MSKWYITENGHSVILGPYGSLEAAENVVNGHDGTKDYFPIPEAKASEILRARYVKAAKDAWDVQNACSLSGVALSFANVIVDVRRYVEWAREHGQNGKDLDKRYTRNPIVKLWLYKVMDLCGEMPDDSMSYSEALHSVKEIAGIGEAAEVATA